MPSKVAFISHQNYNPKPLENSIRRAIDLCGFDLAGVGGKNVLLKPNMLGAYPQTTGVTTHPAFVSAVARIFLDAGASVSIGDSPNGVHLVDEVWKVTGISDVCRELCCKEARFEAAGSLEKNGIRFSRAVLDADIVVNLPKFKTHGLTILTLAVKNLYGCVSGMQKTRFHRIYNDTKSFAELLVRIAETVRPGLTLIDGIVGMDGNGPSGGDMVELGLIVAGTNVHTVDAACCELLGLETKELDTLAAAERLGVWNTSEEIELAGDPIGGLRPRRFNLPATYTKGMRDWRISRFVIDRIWSGLSTQPVINAKKCQRCFLCVGSCPVCVILPRRAHYTSHLAAANGLRLRQISRKIAQRPPEADASQFFAHLPCLGSLSLQSARYNVLSLVKTDDKTAPKIDEKKCIQCMCCHEACPHRAIDLKVSWAIKVARWLSERTKKPSLHGKH